jgi:hypothetical protein
VATRYAFGITWCRQESKVRDARGCAIWPEGQPDFWEFNAFRERYPKALDDVFMQVLQSTRAAGLGHFGHVATHFTRAKVNASPKRVDSVLRRAKHPVDRRMREKLRGPLRRVENPSQEKNTLGSFRFCGPLTAVDLFHVHRRPGGNWHDAISEWPSRPRRHFNGQPFQSARRGGLAQSETLRIHVDQTSLWLAELRSASLEAQSKLS